MGTPGRQRQNLIGADLTLTDLPRIDLSFANLPRPRPRVPDDQHQERTLQNAQEVEVRPAFADDRRHDGDDVKDRQDDIRPTVDLWREDECEEDHHARDGDVDRGPNRNACVISIPETSPRMTSSIRPMLKNPKMPP